MTRSDSTIDYSRMSYPIEGMPDTERIVERFPDLTALSHVFDNDDVPDGVDNDKVLRYLIYMFAPGTPLRTEIPDFKMRKQFVLRKINIEANEDGQVADGYGEMCLMRQDWIIDRFIAFTRLFRITAYEKLAFAEVRNSQLAKAILKSEIDKATDDKNFQAGRAGWYKDIDDALKEIMDGETSRRAEEKITYRVKMDNLGLRPEEFTREYKDTGTVFKDIIP